MRRRWLAAGLLTTLSGAYVYVPQLVSLPNGATVDPRCSLTPGATPGDLRVRTAFGTWSGGDTPADAAFDRALGTRPVLCTVGKDQEGKVALAGLSTDVHYLLRAQPHGSRPAAADGSHTVTPGHHPVGDRRPSLHAMLVAKADYAARWRMPYFLWLGRLVPATLAPKIDCREPSTSTGHVFKALALWAVFKHRPSLEALVYVDMDTLPYRADVAPSEYLRLAPTADLFGATNPVKPVVLNTGVMLLRNTPWANDFLRRWWENRCGFMDQLSFWRTLFETWSEGQPLWSFDADVFGTYRKARHDALPQLTRTYHTLVPGLGDARWLCRDDCREAFELTGCLLEPVQLGKVLVLPVVPFSDGEHRVPPAMSRDNAGGWRDDQWFCHANCHAPGDKVRKTFSDQRRNPTNVKRCVKELSNDYFVCPCGEVARDFNSSLAFVPPS